MHKMHIECGGQKYETVEGARKRELVNQKHYMYNYFFIVIIVIRSRQ